MKCLSVSLTAQCGPLQIYAKNNVCITLLIKEETYIHLKLFCSRLLWCKNKLEKKVELGHFWQIKKMAHFSCQCQLCVNYPPTSNEKEWQNYNKNEKKKVSYLCIQILYFLHLVQYAALIVFLVYALKVPHVVFTCTHVDMYA